MSSQPLTTGTGGEAAIEMPLIHRLFTKGFSEARDLLATNPSGPQAQAIAEHLSFMLDGIHAHHSTEDELVWPVVISRAGADAALVERMEQQHAGIHAASEAMQTDLRAWRAAQNTETTRALSTSLEHFLDLLLEHLAAEEKDVVPLIDRHMTAKEWSNVGEKSFAKIPPSRRLLAMGHMKEVATPAEMAHMNRNLPLPAKAMWRLVGQRRFARYIGKVRATA